MLAAGLQSSERKSERRALWVAVVMQALRDASGTGCNDLERDTARSWFNLSSADFRETCYLADLEPEYVLRKAREFIAQSIASRKAGIKGILGHQSKPVPVKRVVATFTHDGKTLTMAQWSELSGVPAATINSRLRTGHSMAVALTLGKLPRERVKYGVAAKRYVYNGRSRTLTDWSLETGVSVHTLRRRLGRGSSFADAITRIPYQRASNDNRRGVVSNLPAFQGTGGGSTLQEIPEITFSQTNRKAIS